MWYIDESDISFFLSPSLLPPLREEGCGGKITQPLPAISSCAVQWYISVFSEEIYDNKDMNNLCGQSSLR